MRFESFEEELNRRAQRTQRNTKVEEESYLRERLTSFLIRVSVRGSTSSPFLSLRPLRSLVPFLSPTDSSWSPCAGRLTIGAISYTGTKGLYASIGLGALRGCGRHDDDSHSRAGRETGGGFGRAYRAR